MIIFPRLSFVGESFLVTVGFSQTVESVTTDTDRETTVIKMFIPSSQTFGQRCF